MDCNGWGKSKGELEGEEGGWYSQTVIVQAIKTKEKNKNYTQTPIQIYIYTPMHKHPQMHIWIQALHVRV